MYGMRKLSIWHNPRFERWDAEVWYEDGGQERITRLDTRKLSEMFGYIKTFLPEIAMDAEEVTTDAD